jgi:CheY-like chemotaxis protein
MHDSPDDPCSRGKTYLLVAAPAICGLLLRVIKAHRLRAGPNKGRNPSTHYPENLIGASTSCSKEGAMVKILCVDDDSSILELYYEELSEEGYKVLLARNGQEALKKYQEEVPQLIILDIRMPRMDGIEALNAILGKNRQAAVILNTAFPQYRQNFMTWGAEAYLIKSSDLSELKQKVREVLARCGKVAKEPSGGDQD